jgi:hypothetical protein
MTSQNNNLNELFNTFFSYLNKNMTLKYQNDDKTHSDYSLVMLDKIIKNKDISMLINYVNIIFYVCDVKKSKRDRFLFYSLLKNMYNFFPELTLRLLKEISNYGNFKDYINLFIFFKHEDKVKQEIISIYSEQLLKDFTKMNESEKMNEYKDISLAAKYAPRERSTTNYQFYIELVNKLFGSSSTPHKEYRNFIVKLSRHIEISEILIQKDKFNFIDINKNYAYDSLKSIVMENKYKVNFDLSSNSSNDEIDFDKYINPENIMMGIDLSLNNELFNSLWNELKRSIIISKSDYFFNIIPAINIYETMNNYSMLKIKSMSLLMYDVCGCEEMISTNIYNEALHLNGISLTEQYDIINNKIIYTKNFDIYLFFNKILKTFIEYKVRPENTPDILIFSDMSFDSNYTHEMYNDIFIKLEIEYRKNGKIHYNQPFILPKIIFWTPNNILTKEYTISKFPYIHIINNESPIEVLNFIQKNKNNTNLEKYISVKMILNSNRYNIKDIIDDNNIIFN